MIQPWHLPLLFATGLVAGFVDAIAGGGGLITLPVLLGLGFSPQAALGTNKLQATFGSGSAAWHYARAKTVAWRECGRGFAFAFLGAAAGTLSVQRVNPSFLKQVIPFLLIAVALYTLFKPRLGAEDIQPRVSRSWFDVWAGLLLGFYDGFFGPGTGTFWAMACMLFLGLNMTRATGYTKVMNFASNSSSLIFFLLAGQAYFAAGLTMAAGQLVGARFGSRMVIAKGTKFIRPIFITVVLAITAKLIYNNSGL